MEPHKQYNLSGLNDNPDQNKQPNFLDQSFINGPSLIRTDKDFIVKDFFTINNTDAIFKKGQIINRRPINTLITGSNSTIVTTDYLVCITNLSYAPLIGLPLPSLVGSGKTYIIKDEAGGAATTTITIQSDGEKTIDGSSSTTITSAYGSKRFYSDGSNWFTF